MAMARLVHVSLTIYPIIFDSTLKNYIKYESVLFPQGYK